MIFVSRLEVVFSKSNVCFGGVIVAPGDGSCDVIGMECEECCHLNIMLRHVT